MGREKEPGKALTVLGAPHGLALTLLWCPAVRWSPRGLHPADLCQSHRVPVAEEFPGRGRVPVTAGPRLPAGGGDQEPRPEGQVRH